MSDILGWLGIGSNLTSSVSTIGGTSVGVAAASSEGLRAEFVETSVFLSDNSGGFVGGAVFGGAVVASTSTTLSWGDPGVIYFRNDMPYTATEKRAEQVYRALNGDHQKALEKPVLITESQEAVGVVSQAFGNGWGCVMENLELFEELLEGVANKAYSN